MNKKQIKMKVVMFGLGLCLSLSVFKNWDIIKEFVLDFFSK